MSLFRPMRGDSSRVSLDITPFHDGWCYYTMDDEKFYIDSKDENGVEKRSMINPDASTTKNVVLGSSGWTNGTQTVSVSGMTPDKNGVVGVSPDASDTQLFAAKNADLRVVSQQDGSLTIAAAGKTPSCDIPVLVILFQ